MRATLADDATIIVPAAHLLSVEGMGANHLDFALE
jgi:hypothetical protein